MEGQRRTGQQAVEGVDIDPGPKDKGEGLQVGLEQSTVNSDNSSWVLMFMWARGGGAGRREEKGTGGFQMSALFLKRGTYDRVQDGPLGARAGLGQAACGRMEVMGSYWGSY